MRLSGSTNAYRLHIVPKKVLKTRKDGHVRATDEDEDMILLDGKGPPQNRADTTTSPTASRAPKPQATSDSETEPESEGEELLLATKPKGGPGLPTPTASPQPELDPQRAPGRIIGNTFPLRDFRKNLAQGDVVTKAVEDMGVVVREIVERPFSGRRKDEIVECLTILRETCLKVS